MTFVQGFFTREIEREAQGVEPIFRRYEPGQQHKRKFRNYLASAFWRYCRDELDKDSRRRTQSLETVPEQSILHAEFERLAVRELLNDLRAKIAKITIDPLELLYFSTKWPTAIEHGPMTDKDVLEHLNQERQQQGLECLTRSQLRTVKKKVIERLAYIFDRALYQDFNESKQTDQALKDYLISLRKEQNSLED